MPETLRSLVGDGSLEPPTLNASPTMIYRRHKLAKQAKERAEKGQVVEEVEEVIRPPRKKVGTDPAMGGGLTRAVSAIVCFPDSSDARDPAALHFRFVAVSRVLLYPVSGHPTMFGIYHPPLRVLDSRSLPSLPTRADRTAPYIPPLWKTHMASRNFRSVSATCTSPTYPCSQLHAHTTQPQRRRLDRLVATQRPPDRLLLPERGEPGRGRLSEKARHVQDRDDADTVYRAVYDVSETGCM
jgi:hypothetical protein